MFASHMQSNWDALQISLEVALVLTLAMAVLGIVTVLCGVIYRGLLMLARRAMNGRVTLTTH